MMETWLPRKLRILRMRQGLTLIDAAKKTGVTRATLSELERGHRHPVAPTVAKIAKGYGVPVEELLEEPSPLAPAPSASPPPDAAASGAGQPEEAEAGQQRTVPDALRSYMKELTADYQRELGDPDSPHFRTATAATLWAEGVRRDAKRWADWAVEEASIIMSRHATASAPLFDAGVWADAFKVMGPIYTLNELARRAEKRIEAMNDVPDEVARKRYERARREAEESVSGLRELQAASG